MLVMGHRVHYRNTNVKARTTLVGAATEGGRVGSSPGTWANIACNIAKKP